MICCDGFCICCLVGIQCQIHEFLIVGLYSYFFWLLCESGCMCFVFCFFIAGSAIV